VIALVDYDNVVDAVKRRGPVHVLQRLVDTLGSRLLVENELRCRLYGGWFEEATLTRRAQGLLPVLRAEFPQVMTAMGGDGTHTVVVHADLVFGLAEAPSAVLTHTFRPRLLPTKVVCGGLPFLGCANLSACPIAPVSSLMRDQRCPEFGCQVGLSSVLTNPEQKLVDTMLSVDLLHFARAGANVLAVVSTDDDLWPGIQAAGLAGASVVHVHPVPGRQTPPHYLATAGSSYSQVAFE